MGEGDKFVLGLMIGLMIGLPLGWILAATFIKATPQTIIFERDEKGRIREIHYTVGVKK
jgi:hypothetical protein